MSALAGGQFFHRFTDKKNALSLLSWKMTSMEHRSANQEEAQDE
jgi:hypothetical protein